MSYCRFSSNDWSSDIYCYESDEGFVIHVAAARKVFRDALPQSVPCDPDHLREYVARQNAILRMLETAQTVVIGLPHDGETFVEDSACTAAERLEALRAMGYQVPQIAIDELTDEARE